MTTTAEPLLPAAEATWFDRWRRRAASDPALHRRLSVLAPLLVTLLAAVLRLANLGYPHALVFDETYYVKDAWSQWVLGFPSGWPDGADAAVVGGDLGGFTGVGSFVVHPPLGKWLIGAGMFVFGAPSSFGWRIAVALAGIATVLLVYVIAKQLTGSIAFATVAGGLLAIDGLAIVMSRTALLDGILVCFVLLGVWFVLRDLAAYRRRLAEGEAASWWARPWLLAAGIAFGLACGVKWSGAYVLAAFGILVVVADAYTRYRIDRPGWSWNAARRAGGSFLLLVPAAVVVYLASWTGWLLTDGGWDRHSADQSPATGAFAWVPLPLQSLWLYHKAMYDFHVGLTSGHSYQSPAWQWLLLIRPTSMYWHQDQPGDNGCSVGSSCVQAVSSIPNPLIWYAAVAATLYLVYRLALRRELRDAVVLVGVAATWVPWLLYPNRTIFQFYTIAMLPFMVLALTTALRDIAGGPDAALERRRVGQWIVIGFGILAIAVSVFWYPVWTAMTVPYEFWRLHNWLPSWI